MLEPAPVARSEQGGEREQAGAWPVDEPQGDGVVAVEVRGRAAVGHHRRRHGHERDRRERPEHHDQEVALGGAVDERSRPMPAPRSTRPGGCRR